MLGSGAVIVMDDTRCMVKSLLRLSYFYQHESCGQCTPCREGTGWLVRVAQRVANGEGQVGDVELMASIAHGIAGNTICPLGEAAAWPMLGFLTKFRPDFEAKLMRAQYGQVHADAQTAVAAAQEAAERAGATEGHA